MSAKKRSPGEQRKDKDPSADALRASVPVAPELVPVESAPTEAAEEPATETDADEPQAGTSCALPDHESAEAKPSRETWPVVGIGASAGGLEAFTELLKHLAPDTGMSFIFVQHLDPRYKSSLVEILGKSTTLPVVEAKDSIRLERNHIYVAPADSDLALMNGVLQLMPRPEHRARHVSIDCFFRSLADDCGNQAIAVVLSGTGTDGALGLGAVKAAGGITLVQDPNTAKYDGMPAAGIASGFADFSLPPHRIAEEFAAIGRHPYLGAIKRRIDESGGEPPEELRKIFVLLRRISGVDFGLYKRTTIERRITRRMLLHKIGSLHQYVKFLQESPSEVEALFEDMLINVTGFFRDPETFTALKRQVFPAIMRDKRPEAPVRIWVPGCSTGEEAYSLAIALLEHFNEHDLQSTVQIFATDVSEQAIARARVGIYPENIMADVSPERLRRFFTRIGTNYQISKSIRDMCVFARQNVISDPPFSQIDLLSCRNLLIYLGQAVQKRIIPMFHFALKRSGFLLLGTSETIGVFSELFTLVDRKQKIYAKKLAALRPPLDFGVSDAHGVGTREKGTALPAVSGGSRSLREIADCVILSRYVPSGVVINEQLDILQFRGQTGRYLEPAPGDASLNLLKMARPGLAVELRAAIHDCRKEKTTVRRKAVKVPCNDSLLDVVVEVIPLESPENMGEFMLVLFQETPSAPSGEPATEASSDSQAQPGKSGAQKQANRDIECLTDELTATKQTLQAIIEEHEVTNEELRAANEEIQSSNEELQSTNEELETAKEELQSTNEELTTLNEELENRNLELCQALNDGHNLVNSVNIPVVILDNDKRIRSFTPSAERVLKLIPADQGRPIKDLNLGILVEDLEQKIHDVMRSLDAVEEEVQARDGRWYSLRIRPYRTTDNKIAGAVLAWLDISRQKEIEAQAASMSLLTESILAILREPLLVLNADLRVESANRAFFDFFRATQRETEHRLLYELGNGQWNIPRLRTLLEDIIPRNSDFSNFEVEHEFPLIGHRRLLLNARRIDHIDGRPHLILLAMEDVTDG